MLKDTLVEFNAGMFGQAMFIAAPESEWRHYLRGVYIQPSTLGGVNIIATDAHRLIYFHDRLGTCSLKRGITIPRKDLRELISMSRKTANINKKITVKFRKLRSGRLKTKRSIYTAKLEKVRNSYVFSPPDGAFPDIQNVIKDQTIDNENNKSILYNAKYILDFKRLFVDRRYIKNQFIAINQSPDGRTIACTENGFYITMPIVGDNNKHMLDFIFGLSGKEENIFQKAFLKNKGVEGYKFLKDILGLKDAKVFKKPLLKDYN